MSRMKHIKLFEYFINEKRPEWKDSDAPDANGRFRDLGIKDLAAWLIKTRKKDVRKISGSLTQQIVFNRNENPEYAKKMEKVRREVYRQLGREDLLEGIEFSEKDTFDYVNLIKFGNPLLEHLEVINSECKIKSWFIENGIAQQIIDEAPLNNSEKTHSDLRFLQNRLKITTPEEILFSRYVDSVENYANSFLDIIKEENPKITMGDFFKIDSQTEPILYYLKDKINRPRPYQLARELDYEIFPIIKTDACSAAYPSGHALSSYVVSMHFANKHPVLKDRLLKLGEDIANSRIHVGIHYPSDSEISKNIAQIIIKNRLIHDEMY